MVATRLPCAAHRLTVINHVRGCLHALKRAAHTVQASGNGVSCASPIYSDLHSESGALQLIQATLAGELAPEQAARQVASYANGIKQLEDWATLDAHNDKRMGMPEVVWGPGKTPQQVATIMLSLVEHQRVAIATRIDPDVYAAVRKLAPGVEYNALARILTLRSPHAHKLPKQERLPGTVAIVSAGTADLAVAEECRIIADHLGVYAFKVYDVGVAGLQRILLNLGNMRAADVVVVISGMEGALPSVVAGLVEAPVIAVPTSVGYGAALSGLAPLLASLNSCTPGVTVCNIDNGFGAACTAARMLRMAAKVSRNQRVAADAAATVAASAAAPAP